MRNSGWVVLQQSGPEPLTSAYQVRDALTVGREAFSRSGTLTRIEVATAEGLEQFGLYDTTAFFRSEALDLYEEHVPQFEPVQGSTIRLAGALPDLPLGRPFSITGRSAAIHITANLGGVWRADGPVWASTGRLARSVQALAIDQHGQLIAGTDSGAFRFADSAWQPAGLDGQAIDALALDAQGVLWAGTAQGAFLLRRSAWESAGLAGRATRSLALGGAEGLYAGTSQGVFRRAGAAWEAAGLREHDVRAVALGARGQLYAATAAGVFIARGANWASAGALESEVWSLAVDSSGRVVAGTRAMGSCAATANPGRSSAWLARRSNRLRAGAQGTLYAGTYGAGSGAGTTRAELELRAAGVANDVRALLATSQGAVIAGLGDKAIFTSPDGLERRQRGSRRCSSCWPTAVKSSTRRRSPARYARRSPITRSRSRQVLRSSFGRRAAAGCCAMPRARPTCSRAILRR